MIDDIDEINQINPEIEQLSMDIEEPVEDQSGIFTVVPGIVYHITDFDGPIELLYQLIKDAKIQIEDLFISEVTGQYVDIIRNTPKEELDYDYAAEFITLAAELIYLKSDKTLPRQFEDEDPYGPEFEKQLLINKLKEMEIIKNETEKLKEYETLNSFTRMPTYSEKDFKIALVNFSLDKLVEAFAKVLVRSAVHEQEIIPKKVSKDRFSVHDQMLNIKNIIYEKKELEFTELFTDDFDKTDMVTTFLAVLELLKYGVIVCEQEEVFGKIRIYANDDVENTQIDFINEEDDGEYK